MGEVTVFSLYVSPHLDGGRVPQPGLDGGGVPLPGLDGGGVLQPSLDGGTQPGLDGGGRYPGQVWMEGVHQPGLDGGGYLGYPPQPGLDGGGYSSQVWMVGGIQGTPWPGLDGGQLGYPPPIRQSSIASTCYPAGGMPLAFTQEDFLVLTCFSTVNCVHVHDTISDQSPGKKCRQIMKKVDVSNCEKFRVSEIWFHQS